jgi:PAS domain S-box-containing protein
MSKPRILIVEDERIIADGLRNTLERSGYEVIAMINSGEEAVTRSRATKPDIILMDITLAGHIDGIQATEEIRKTQRVPIVFMTAHLDETTLQRAKVTEPAGYVRKPLDERELYTTIELALSKGTAVRHQRELERLAHVTKSIGEFVVITDTHGRITYANRAFADRFGCTLDESVGQRAEEFLAKGAFPEQLRGVIRGTARGGWSGDLVARTCAGTEFWMSLTTSLLTHEDQVLGAVIVSRDITERKTAEQALTVHAAELFEAKSRAEEQARMLELQAVELRQAKEEAIQASRLKSEFVANMSHEIRTPMNGVIGMTGLLLDTALSPDQREYASIIRTSAERLVGIINDILDFSKMEAGTLALERGIFELRSAVKEAVDLLAPRAHQKHLGISFAVHESVPDALYGDAGRFRQILVNLLNNAVKFTEQGEISVRVTVEAGSVDDVRLHVVVSDTGIGIAPEARMRLFLPFSQADGSTTRKYGGTGLGLVISKQLVELMGGTIGVASEEGKGSSFWFTAPFSKVAGTEHHPLRSVSVPERHVRALVAEGDPASRTMMLEMLTSMGCRAESVANGLEVLHAVQTVSYDMVFMNCMLPQLDGFAATSAIRTMEGTHKHTVVIAMASQALSGDKKKFQVAGMDDYITTPITPGDLETVVNRWDGKGNGKESGRGHDNGNGNGNETASPAPEPAVAVAEEPAIDNARLDELAELGDEDTQWLGAILDKFNEDASSRIIKLMMASETGDPVLLSQTAHTLKGSCGNIGAIQMALLAQRLQALGKTGSVDGASDLVRALEAEFTRVKSALDSYRAIRERAQ